jgi:hypothetical protein
MAIDFKLKDVMHRITAKFFPAYLPEAKKPYVLHTKYQPELDVHGIASKADVYNITTSPKVIEEGLNAGMELITYLAADGFKIKTPIFTLKVAIPGEYEGSETHLPDGVKPQGRLNLSSELRKYIRDHVELQIDGIEENPGIISEVINLETGEVNETIKINKLCEVRGAGLKIAADAEHTDDVGIFLENATSGTRVKLEPTGIAVNEPRDLKALVHNPAGIFVDTAYYVVIRTQSAATNSSSLLKHVREMKSDFTVTTYV